jgi:hypothetical protein
VYKIVTDVLGDHPNAAAASSPENSSTSARRPRCPSWARPASYNAVNNTAHAWLRARKQARMNSTASTPTNPAGSTAPNTSTSADTGEPPAPNPWSMLTPRTLSPTPDNQCRS